MPVRGTVTCPVLIGREPEREALRTDAQRVLGGPWVTVVSGPAGTGKTRLLVDARARAEAVGCTVLGGACAPGAVRRYGPITSALLRHLRGLPSDEADRLYGGAARLVRGLVPQRFEDAPDLSRVDPTVVQGALLELFAVMQDQAPVALAIEDVHWAGADTLEAIAHVAAEAEGLRLWLLLTHRDDDPDEADRDEAQRAALERLFATIARRPHTAMALDALTVAETAAMVAATLGAEAPGGFVEALHRRAAGNPLLVEEFCRTLVEDDRLDPAAGRWPAQLGELPLPPSMRDTVSRRLDGLAARDVVVLQAAATIDDEVDVELLMAVCDRSREEIDAALDAGGRAQILVERREGGIGTTTFRHALLREAVRDLVPVTRRQDLHRRIVDALLARLPADEASAAVVEHLAAAGAREEASSHALVAAARARRLGAPAAARSLHERAVELAAPGTRHRAVAALAAADYLELAEPHRTLELASEAHHYALAHEDRLMVARSLMRTSAVRMHLYGRAGRASVIEATDWVTGLGGEQEGDLLCQAVELLVSDGSHTDLTLARELLPRAEVLLHDDPAWAARLSTLRCTTATTVPDALDAGRAAVEVARADGDPLALERALWTLGTWLLWDVGELDAAEASLRQAQELAELFTARRPGLALPVLAEIAAYRGAYEVALAEAEDPVWREAMAEHDACWVLVEVHRRCGRGAAALAAAERAAELLAERTSLTARIGAAAALGHGHLARHGAGAALEHFDEALRWAAERSRLYHDVFSPDLARALFDLGDHDRLRDVADEVAGLSTGLPEGTRGAAAAAYCAGLAALAAGRHQEAAVAARTAVAAWSAMPFPARVSEAWCVVAESERRAGNRAASLAAARSALEVAEAIRSGPLTAEARAALDRLGRAGRRAGGSRVGADALTPRERDVVRLTCEGFTAQQVAGRLGLSRRTVETHLAHAKDKLGVASKAELVRVAVELGLNDGSA